MDTKEMKKMFSRIGISYLAMCITAFIANRILKMILVGFGVDIDAIPFDDIKTINGYYILGVPVLYLHLKKYETIEKEKKKFSLLEFIKLFVISTAAMMTGNYMGIYSAGLLTGWSAVNPLVSSVDLSLFSILTTVVLAPVFEEILCRKILIDRTEKYGELMSVLLSGVIFSLFHMNLYQSFYTFMLGCILAYMYIKTHRIGYCMLMHGIINFCGGVLPLLLTQNISPELLSQLDTLTTKNLLLMMHELTPYFIYFVANWVLTVAGIILFVVNIKKICFTEAEKEIPKENIFRTVYLNPGMIVMAVAALVFTAKHLFY